MEFNPAAFGALAVLGAVAAGGGAYLANRHNDADLAQAPIYQVPVAGMVTETENAITPTPAATVETAPSAHLAEAAPAPVRQAAPVRRSTASAEPARRPRTAERAEAAPRPRAVPGPSVAPTSAPADTPTAASLEPEAPVVDRMPVAQDPPRKTYEELVIPADSVIGLQVESAVSSDRAKVEDKVTARVTRDVRVHDQVAIPAGARAEGSITLVDRGGRLKDQARLGIRFHTIVLADGTRLPINTETIYREGDSPARESAAKIGGGAVGGAVLGAIFGGKKGAVIGSTVGAAGGGVAVATSEPSPATLPAGSTVTVRMGSPATVTVER
jgi:hypothetical protein